MSIIGRLGADTCRIMHCVFPLLEWVGFTTSGLNLNTFAEMPPCGTCSRKARRIELNGSISPGSREVRTTWSSHFESSLMESILEYSITYPEVKKHCSLRHMQTDSRVKRRLVYWHYPMLNLLKIRTVNQS